MDYYFKNGKYRTNHKICEILNGDLTKGLLQDF